MARITVEDCIQQVPNRFELVLLAAQRARDISAGAPLLVPHDNDKNPVIALREIAENKLDLDHLRYELIYGLRRYRKLEEALTAREEDEEEDLEAQLAELVPVAEGGAAAGGAGGEMESLPETLSYAEFDVPDRD